MSKTPPADPEHHHLTWERIERFLTHTEQPLERHPLFHLLAVCEVCREAARPLLDLYERGDIDGYVSLLDVEILVSEWNAPELWERLEEEVLGKRPSYRRMERRLRDDPRWPTWGLVAWLARQSVAEADLDPDSALARARIAALGAGQLQPDDPAPKEWLEELRAFVEAAAGHVHALRGEWGKAEAKFRRAHRHLAASVDPADYLPFRPGVFELEAEFHRKHGALTIALDRLNEAWEAWQVVERARPEDRARVLVAKGNVLRRLGRWDDAQLPYEDAGEILGVPADPYDLEVALGKREEE